MHELGRYKIVGRLGRGGQGTVFRGVDPRLGREVAIKLQTGELSALGRARYEREARALARLHHPNIVPVHDVGEERGRPYLVLELVAGGSLQDRLDERGPLDEREAAEVVRQLAEAVDYAHERGVLHRDLKPNNVLLGAGRGRDVPMLVDFGLAKELVSDATPLSQSGGWLGTPGYWAPEQLRGKEVGPHTDVWGLGALLYSCLSGEAPLRCETVVESLQAVERPPVAPSRRRGAPLDPELERICLRCLELDPARRFASAGEVRAALEDFLARSPERAGQGAPKRVWLAAAGAGVLAALLVLAAATGGGRVGAPGDPASASGTAGVPADVTSKQPTQVGDDGSPRPESTPPTPDEPTPPGHASPPPQVATDPSPPRVTTDPAAAAGLPSETTPFRAVGSVRLSDVWGEYRAKHLSLVLQVAVSPDGRRLASVSLDGVAMLWDSAAGQAVRVLGVGAEPLQDVAFSSDGALVLVCSPSRLIAQDVETGAVRWSVDAHPKATRVTPLSGGRACTTGSDGVLRVWDLQGGQEQRTLRLGAANVKSALAADERVLVVACRGELSAWDLEEGRRLRGLGTCRSPSDVAVSSDGQRAAVLDGGEVHVFDVGAGRELRGWKACGEGDPNHTRGLLLTPDARRAVSGTSYGKLRVWDLERGELLREIETGHTGWIETLCLTPGGGVVTAGNDQQLRSVALGDGRPLWPEQRGHGSAVTSLAVLPDGRTVSGSVDGTLRIWRAGGAESERWLDAPMRAWVQDVAPLDADRIVFAAGTIVCVWQLETNKAGACTLGSRVHSIVRRSPGFYAVTDKGGLGYFEVTGLDPVALSALSLGKIATRRAIGSVSGERLGLLGEPGGFSLYAVTPGASSRGRTIDPPSPGARVQALAFLDEQALLIGSDDGTVSLVDAQHDMQRSVGQHRGLVSAVAGDLASGLVVSAGQDGVRVWDLQRGELAWLPLGASADFAVALAVEPGGRAFVVGTRRGVVLRFAVAR